MQRKFVSNLLLVGGLNLLVKPFYLLIIEARIQDETGPAAFGGYFALLNLSFVFNILLDLGITNWNTRHTAGNESIHPEKYGAVVSLKLSLAVIYLIAAVVAGLLLGYQGWQLSMLLVLSFNQILASLILYLRSYLAGMHFFQADSLLSVLDRLILSIHMGLLLWTQWGGGSFRIEWLIYGQTFSYGLSAAVALLLVVRKLHLPAMRFDLAQYKGILRESLPFAVLILISQATARLDGVLLERMKGAEEAGFYAVGYRFFDALNMMSYLFAGLLLPIFSRMLFRNQDIAALLRLSTNILLTGVSTAAICACIWPQEILLWIYHDPPHQATASFPWLMLSAAFFSLQYTVGTLLTAAGLMRQMIRIAVIACLFNILANLFIIPNYGAAGAAVVSACSQLIVLFLQTSFVIAHWQLPFRTYLLRVFGFVAALVFFAVFLHKRLHPGVHVLYPLLSMMLGAILLAILSGVLQPRRALRAWKQEKD